MERIETLNSESELRYSFASIANENFDENMAKGITVRTSCVSTKVVTSVHVLLSLEGTIRYY